MNQDLSILTLVTQASLVVQLVMAGLLIVSLTSWTVIFGKVIGRVPNPPRPPWAASSPAACANS